MSAGHPLTDEDRWPWLQAIADEIDRVCEAGEHAVIACSALKRAYRDILVHGRSDVRIVYLDGHAAIDRQTGSPSGRTISCRRTCWPASSRRWSRRTRDENPVTVSIDASVDAIVDDIVRQTEAKSGRTATPTAGTAHDPHRPRRLRCRRHAADQGQDPDRQGRSARCGSLEDSGVGFTIASSRPTIGMRFLIEPLRITLPVGSFNGSSIVDPQIEPDRTASDPGIGGATQHRCTERIRRRCLAVHQRQWLAAERRRRIRSA